MKNLTLKTTGAAQNLAETVEFDAKVIADALQFEISGGKANENQAGQLTQGFINNHNIIAKYTSGTFLGFKIQDSALDEFESFKK